LLWDVLKPLLFFAAILTIIGIAIYFNFAHSSRLVQLWAKDNGYTLIKYERQLCVNTPFKICGKGQVVWAIRVTNRQGEERDAWLLCGDFLFGTLSDSVEVKWADPGQSAFR
jgi:hypothetical protein